MSEQEVRQRIIDAATELFGEKGYGSTSIRDVARSAKVSNPTLYYHFGNKEGLYLETIRTHMEAMRAGLSAVVEQDKPIGQRMLEFIDAHASGARENKAAARLLTYANHRPQSGDPRVDLMSSHQHNQVLLHRLYEDGRAAGLIREDVEEIDFAIALIGLVILAGYAALAELPVPPDMSARMLRTLLKGVG